MATDDSAIRDNWKVTDHVEIWSESAQKWFQGTIVRIFTDDEGEWIEVQYKADNDLRLKQVERHSPEDIRPMAIPNGSSPHSPSPSYSPRSPGNGNANHTDRPHEKISIFTQNKIRPERHTIERSSNWKAVEFSEDHYAKPVLIDGHNIVIATGDMNENVYQLNTDNNELEILFKYPAKLWPFQVTTVMDHNKQRLYLYCNYNNSKQNVLMEFSTETGSLQTYSENLKDVGAFPVIVGLSGNLHLIGGRLNSLHLTWNDAHKRFDERPFRSKMIHGHGVIPLESKKQILVLGGNDSHLWGGYLGSIWLCDTVPTIKWRHLDKVAMPNKMSLFGYIKSKDENQVIIFGGKTKTGLRDEIWILNLNTWKWTKSNVKCPKKGKFHAVKTRNGFVHLFEIDTKHYWKIKLEFILGAAKGRSGSFSVNADDLLGRHLDDDQKQKETDIQHLVIEKHNEIQKLKKQLRKSEQKVADLIQQNIKLNHEMRSMEKDHRKEVQDLKKQLAEFDIFEQ